MSIHLITANFSREEFSCPCCGRGNIDELLVRRIQDVRDILGSPIHINSGFRCAEHNREVGGAEHSLHLAGMAADLSFYRASLREAYEAVRQVVPWCDVRGGQGGLGLYPDRYFIHVDIGPAKRWGQIGRRYVTIEQAEAMLPAEQPPEVT